LDRALSEYRSKGDNHPLTAGGTALYNEMINALRDELSPFGFKKKRVNNVELAVNQENKTAIWFCRSNQDTGKVNGKPASMRSRGDFTLSLLNLEQQHSPNLELFPENNVMQINPNELTIWALLVHLNPRPSGELHVQLELSVPKTYNLNGHINSFSPRVLFDDIDFDSTNDLIVNTDSDFNEEIDFDITVNDK
jgi:hypothetical protein